MEGPISTHIYINTSSTYTRSEAINRCTTLSPNSLSCHTFQQAIHSNSSDIFRFLGLNIKIGCMHDKQENNPWQIYVETTACIGCYMYVGAWTLEITLNAIFRSRVNPYQVQCYNEVTYWIKFGIHASDHAILEFMLHAFCAIYIYINIILYMYVYITYNIYNSCVTFTHIHNMLLQYIHICCI